MTGLALVLGLLAQFPEAPAAPGVLRGVWLSPGDLEGRGSIAVAATSASEAGANVLFVPAWVRGTISFRSAAARERLGWQDPERDLVAQAVFEAHRHGLEVLAWVEAGLPCPDPEACPLQAEQPDAFLLGEDGKLIVADGVASLDPRRGPAADVVADLRSGYDLDGIVLRGRADDPPALFVSQASEPSDLVLPPISSGAPTADADAILTLARVIESAAELADGAWTEPARPPWREDRGWRPRTDPIPPFAGSGLWNWKSQRDAPDFLAIDGGESGHLSWPFEPTESGAYDLYVWIPAREDLSDHLSFRVATAGSSRTVGIDTSHAPNRGWVYLGWAKLQAGRKTEIARLEAQEVDATRLTAAGPIVPLLDRRQDPR